MTNTEQLGKLIINRTYDVPYLAGYNKRGTVIYIDRKVPTELPIANGKKREMVNILPYLALHESVEDHVEEMFGYKYQVSHKIATAAEREAVEADGHSWALYESHLRFWIEKCRQDFSYLPPDLDLQPYIDCKDDRLLAKMVSLRGENRTYV